MNPVQVPNVYGDVLRARVDAGNSVGAVESTICENTAAGTQSAEVVCAQNLDPVARIVQGGHLIAGGVDRPHRHAEAEDARAESDAENHDRQYGFHQRESVFRLEEFPSHHFFLRCAAPVRSNKSN